MTLGMGELATLLAPYQAAPDLSAYVPVTKSGQQSITATGVGNDISLLARDEVNVTATDGNINFVGGATTQLSVNTGYGGQFYTNDPTSGWELDSTHATGYFIVNTAGGAAELTSDQNGFVVQNLVETNISGPDGHFMSDLVKTRVSSTAALVLLNFATAPATASSTCIAGTYDYDSSYIYICVATDTWKRSALATW